jgi:DNA polymerase-3 subunit gamma/tau
MSDFIVSARKYRPVTFVSVIGQHAVTNTLKNAIKTSHIAHAYLFCGPRGVGKTTCARIFAKTLNCLNRTSETEACNVCESCKAFSESRSYNIHELDAASNNSVEDIRTLIDQVRIPPQIGKYSIYIIDEVHMLSSQAFNAFLKTLEEPPSHAIFILATTEKHKIIPTILSRCQIFDFHRIRIEDSVQYLEHISKNESVFYEVEALNVIAQKADGGMRDALSIYDQMVSFVGNNLTYKGVIESLNVLDYEYYFKLVDAFLEHSVSKVLLFFHEILEKGFDGHHFISGLSSHLRDLLVCKDPITLQLLEVSASIREQYKSQAARCPAEFIFEALNICNQCDVQYKISKNQRLHVELALIQLSNIDPEKKNAEPEVVPARGNTPSPPVNKSVTQQNGVAKPVSTPSAMPATPSLKDALKGTYSKPATTEKQVIEESVPVNAEPKENQPFSQLQLQDSWTKYAEDLKSREPRIYSTLVAYQPVLKENGIIEFPVSNPLQEDLIRNIKTNLLTYLKKSLNNFSLDIVTTITEIVEINKLYTSEDKFDHMAKKNPELIKLKQQFNLDFE